ncbi:MAG: hypothetical protein NC132_02435 [Corallococcus sp.]|nr:hypothetical protein [Corallococcus sp.]MCM1358966.1 hypothetical protein [Corallococcus sp.]MCM1394955.1 hypothetical protein [Corallococcus sp.]
MNCKLIMNIDSGNCERLDVDALLCKLGCDACVETIDSGKDWNAEGYDTVIVCGGDGTLHNALSKCQNKKIFYAPCGTLNELAATNGKVSSVGKVNDEYFSYVCATGSFTEIGYAAQNKHKKRWKSLAYLPQVIKCYRCHEIGAKLDVDGASYEGKYTLLMILKSYRCFGFSFNKDYKKTHKTYLLAINALGRDCLKNRVKMFAPFFRIFVCGTKPKVGKNWMLVPFDQLTIELDEPQNFCFDGEKRVLSGKIQVCEQVLAEPITVVKTPFLRRKRCKHKIDFNNL